MEQVGWHPMLHLVCWLEVAVVGLPFVWDQHRTPACWRSHLWVHPITCCRWGSPRCTLNKPITSQYLVQSRSGHDCRREKLEVRLPRTPTLTLLSWRNRGNTYISYTSETNKKTYHSSMSTPKPVRRHRCCCCSMQHFVRWTEPLFSLFHCSLFLF